MDKTHSNVPAQASMCPARRRSNRASMGGFGLLEAIMSMGLIMLIALSTTQTFLVSNRVAATNRVLTAARTIVQRNLDTAMSLRFDADNVPSVLVVTGTGGAVTDDDGGADNLVNILIQKTLTTQTILVKGTLTRIVTTETNPQGADIRRITFRLTYLFQRRNFTVEMTALRAIDD